MTDTSKDAVDRMVLAMIRIGNTTAANMLTALLAERDAANARADQARDAALVDAMEAVGNLANEFGVAGSPTAKKVLDMAVDVILALRDKPAPAVVVPTTTVRESYVMEGRHPNRQEARDAAKVLMNCNGADINDWSDDIWPDDDCIAALRAIAGGGDE